MRAPFGWSTPVLFDGNVQDLTAHGIKHADILDWVRAQGLDTGNLSPRIVIIRDPVGDGYVIRLYAQQQIVLDGPPPWLPADLPVGEDLGRLHYPTHRRGPADA